MSESQTLKTALHETAHSILHADKKNPKDPAIKEIEAEAWHSSSVIISESTHPIILLHISPVGAVRKNFQKLSTFKNDSDNGP